MKSLTIRGLSDILTKELKKKSSKSGLSLNQTVISLLKKGLGICDDSEFPVYDDLDDLAGTWSKSDAESFQKGIRDFRKIDEDMW